MIGFTPAETLVNRVLVVEDDRDESDFLKEFFSGHGMDVDIARDGGQARAAFTMHQPDMVILELILPNVSGFEVCEQFKRLNESVPVLILTAIDMDDARDLAPQMWIRRLHDEAVRPGGVTSGNTAHRRGNVGEDASGRRTGSNRGKSAV